MSVLRLDRASSVLGMAIVVVEAVQLVLWLVAPQVLLPLLLDNAPTKPTTLVAFLLLGALLGFRLPPLARRAALAGVLVLALEGAVSNALGRPLLSADVLYRDSWQAVGPSGQMALSSALVLLALGVSLVLSTRFPRVVTGLGVAAYGLGLASMVGHLYGVGSLTSLQTSTSMALPTVPVVLAGAVAVLLHHPDLPVFRALRARDTAGDLLRRNLPWALIVPPLVGWLLFLGERTSLYDPAYGHSLLSLLLTGGTVVAVVLGARTAARGERARTAVEDRERLQYLLDGTPVGIFETDADGTRRYVNRRWRELTGMAGGVDDAVEGGAWGSVVHPDDQDRVVAEWESALAEGREYTGRYRYLRPDGTVRWVDTAATAIRAADGTVTRWLGSVSDVTGQVEAGSLLADSERRYRSVVATMAEGVVLQDADGVIVTANDAACRVLGLEVEQMLGGSSIDPRWRAVREDGSDFPTAERPAPVALSRGVSVRDVTMGVHRADGTLVWLEVAAEPLFETQADGSSAVVGVVTTFSDITAQRVASRALARSEEQFRSAMAHAPVGMALVSLEGAFTEVNRSLCRLLGYDESELVGRSFQELTHPDDLASDLELLEELTAGYVDHYTLEKRYFDSDGEVVWVSLAVSMARDEDDQPAYYIAQMQDITVARAARQSLAHRALHDPLTGLANRDLLMDRLSHALSRSARTGVSTVVLFCDLDHFKAVNDELGHETGDLVLVTVADRLRQMVRPSDTVARLGGDEFVVVVEGLAGWDEQRAFAERVRGVLDEPVQVAGRVVRAGASIGVAVARPEDDARSLLREADATMYRAKARGRGRFEVSEDSEVPDLGPVGS
jgi:diguanylate cyclase (GGDEF)-like protein/PAS domain S-box-containing protein